MRIELLPLVGALLLSGCLRSNQPTTDTCSVRKPGDLVITEFLSDPPGADTGREYVELYNGTGEAISFGGFTLYVSRADGSAEKTFLLQSGTIEPAEYYSLGDVREGELPKHVRASYGDLLGALPNSEGRIGIKCGAQEIDEVIYTGAAKSAHARVFTGNYLPDATVNDSELKFCDSNTPLETLPGAFGSPGVSNEPCPDGEQLPPLPSECNDEKGRRPVRAPQQGDLVITELMPDPAAVADDKGEWIELYATADVDLNGLTLNTPSNSLQSATCLNVQPGSYAVLAREASSALNGGLTNVLATHKLILSNSGGTVTLRAKDVVLDAITYKAGMSGASLQLDDNKRDELLNDDPAIFCPGTAPYSTGGDKGTPGSVNQVCPQPLAANQCIDTTTGQPRNIRFPTVGDVVITELMANPRGVDSSKEWVEVLFKINVDLNGLELVNDTTGKTVFNSNTCLQPGEGAFALIVRDADPLVNGNLPDKISGLFTFDLANSASADGGSRAITLRRDGRVLDQITYSTTTEGVSTQVDPRRMEPPLNDDATALCPARADRAYTPDGGNLGTPGGPNDLCP
ncbi:MAG: lamin tail domain-containing protein [Myxococcaceae bacterium]